MKKIELPVYKASYELLLNTFEITGRVKREYKFTIGERLKKELMDMMIGVYMANSTKNKERKRELVEKALERIEIAQISFRLLHDLHEINLKIFVKTSVLVENVRRQLIGWKKVLGAGESFK